MADVDHEKVFGRVVLGFVMNLGNERTGCVDHFQVSFTRDSSDLGRDPMGAKNNRRPNRNVFDLFDEDHALAFEVLDDPFVMNNRMADVEWSAVDFESEINDLDCIRDTGTKSARGSKENSIHEYSLQEFGNELTCPNPATGSKQARVNMSVY